MNNFKSIHCFAFLAVVLVGAAFANAQTKESFVAKAKELSARTGRPILAVAGSNT